MMSKESLSSAVQLLLGSEKQHYLVSILVIISCQQKNCQRPECPISNLILFPFGKKNKTKPQTHNLGVVNSDKNEIITHMCLFELSSEKFYFYDLHNTTLESTGYIPRES